ncbi:MAG: hypothetical protein Q9213_002775 [Squamulea squamosa]
MTLKNRRTGLLSSPLELRTLIYQELFSELHDPLHARNLQDLLRLSRVHEPILQDYSAMLSLNRQISHEMFDAFCSQTWTTYVSWQGVVFLGKFYRISGGHDQEGLNMVTDSGFPYSFPFPFIKQFRIQMQTVVDPDSDEWWSVTNVELHSRWGRLHQVMLALGMLLKQVVRRSSSFQQILIEVNESPTEAMSEALGFWRLRAYTCFNPGVRVQGPRDIRNILGPLKENIRKFQSCVLRLNGWVHQDPLVLDYVQGCGLTMLGVPHAHDKEELRLEGSRLCEYNILNSMDFGTQLSEQSLWLSFAFKRGSEVSIESDPMRKTMLFRNGLLAYAPAALPLRCPLVLTKRQ